MICLAEPKTRFLAHKPQKAKNDVPLWHIHFTKVKISNLGIFTHDVWYAIKITSYHLGKGQPCLVVDNLSTTTERALSYPVTSRELVRQVPTNQRVPCPLIILRAQPLTPV